MVVKQLESLISNVEKGAVQKTFICYMDEKKERKFLVFKSGGIYRMDSEGEVEKLNTHSDIHDIFLSIKNGDVKVIGSGNIGI